MYHIIVNPASQSGRGKKIWSLLEPVLKEKEIAYQLFFSQYPGHVSELAGQISALPGEEPVKLILLGGDGTINEALQGISDFERVWIGYIPTGSSNDLARDLRLPRDPVQSLLRILDCREPVRSDIGLITYHRLSSEESCGHDNEFPERRYFAVSSGIGFDAAVCEEALSSQLKKIFNKIGLGKLTYLGIALKQIIAAKKISCTFTLDSGREFTLKRFLFIAGMVHQYEGGGFLFCPGADIHDGKLDVCVVGDIPKPLILVALPTAFFGKHYMFRGIDKYVTESIRITASAPLWVHTDGEVSVKADAITLSCLRGKLLLLD